MTLGHFIILAFFVFVVFFGTGFALAMLDDPLVIICLRPITILIRMLLKQIRELVEAPELPIPEHRELAEFLIQRFKDQQPPKEPSMLFFLKTRMKLQAQLDTMQLTLKNKQSEFDIEIRNRSADFERQLKDRENQFGIKERNLVHDMEIKLKKQKEDNDIEMQKVLTLTKLDAEQKIARMGLEADKRIAEVNNEKVKELANAQTKHAEELSKIRQEEGSKYHTQMAEALNKMHNEGGVQTKNMHVLTMELLKHARPGVNESRFLTGRVDGGNDPIPATAVVRDGKADTIVVGV